MLTELMRSLRLESERFAKISSDFPFEIKNWFALTEERSSESPVQGFQLVISDPLIGRRSFTVTVTEERIR